ncbi:30S ribosomal protein S10 [Wolbachia endosymbiont of Howardula sp.]|nr:30S ribosomal protein S10 [Wolbachia endosymbiont of Howardula sp.]UWI83429.1 30S ribosomal protein S10 [Wolbachia endosymbiont of Howardula sp.]
MLTLKSFDCRVLELCVRKCIEDLKRSDVKLSGPIALPRENSRFIVGRSPHVDKKSREQFERRTSKRLIVLHNPTPAMIQMLTQIITNPYFPAAVDASFKEVKIKKKLTVREKE